MIGAVLLVIAVVLFIVLSGGGDDSSTTSSSGTTADSEVPVIVVKDGQPVGGVQQLTFTQGDDIRFIVDSDVADEVHFHGYDVGKDVKAGGTVEFNVPATDAGVFEVELESRVEQIAEITVNPS
ncbi:MAG: hypothetical protein QOI10_685 [Solirubrobacterales bacterium]|nr:hypothetical protein [Solirubrobacterales bacterium]